MRCLVRLPGKQDGERHAFADLDTFVAFCNRNRVMVIHPPVMAGGDWELVLMPERG